MSVYKIIFLLWLIVFGLPALGYARYLHDDEENVSGAFVIFFIVLLAGAGIYQMW